MAVNWRRFLIASGVDTQGFNIGDAVNPDHPIFGVHFDGQIMKLIDGLAQFCGDAIHGFGGMDLALRHGSGGLGRVMSLRLSSNFKEGVLAGMTGRQPKRSARLAGGSASFIFVVAIRDYMNTARSPPRGNPAKS